MIDWPTFPKWHRMVTTLCVVAGLLWAYFVMRAYAVEPCNNFLSPTAPAREVMFQIAWLGTLAPEAAHQAVRLAIWCGRCGAAALRGRRLRKRSQTQRQEPMRQARSAVPYYWLGWQATYGSAIFGLLVAFVAGHAAIAENPYCEFSDDLAGLALIYVTAFGFAFLTLEVMHQCTRLCCWCGVVLRHAAERHGGEVRMRPPGMRMRSR